MAHQPASSLEGPDLRLVHRAAFQVGTRGLLAAKVLCEVVKENELTTRTKMRVLAMKSSSSLHHQVI